MWCRSFLYRFWLLLLQNAEAVARGCSIKYVFLKILQSFQENICIGVSIWRTATLLKQDPGTYVFLCFCKIFKNIYFVKHLRTAASAKGSINGNNTVKSLSKIWGFLYGRAGFLVFKYLQQKQIWGNTNICLVYQTRWK